MRKLRRRAQRVKRYRYWTRSSYGSVALASLPRGLDTSTA
jgi:hypothetical protein